jgi:hypothetical protein
MYKYEIEIINKETVLIIIGGLTTKKPPIPSEYHSVLILETGYITKSDHTFNIYEYMKNPTEGVVKPDIVGSLTFYMHGLLFPGSEPKYVSLIHQFTCGFNVDDKEIQSFVYAVKAYTKTFEDWDTNIHDIEKFIEDGNDILTLHEQMVMQYVNCSIYCTIDGKLGILSWVEHEYFEDIIKKILQEFNLDENICFVGVVYKNKQNLHEYHLRSILGSDIVSIYTHYCGKGNGKSGWFITDKPVHVVS